MFKKIAGLLLVTALLALTGCASVPMANQEEDLMRKAFAAPPSGKAGLYIYRDSVLGASLTKMLYLDDVTMGATAPQTYFYREISPGPHKISTQSEFGMNDLMLTAEAGKNHFVRQYIKMGVFVGGANLEVIGEDEAKTAILDCKLAK